MLAWLPLSGHAASCKTTTPRVLVERVMPADCESCWTDAKPLKPAGAMVLDWIAPAGDNAPMQVAAVSEAPTRVDRVIPGQTAHRTSVLRRQAAPRLVVQDGPAWNGYLGLQMTVQRTSRLPADTTGYLALVERVPAGSEGTSVARQLVRVVVGPLPLNDLATQRTSTHLRSVRLPEGARPERLLAVGWVESAGQVVVAGESRTEGCATE
jgi:hypothetical protein